MLVTPYISPKTKTIEYRYRQVFHNGNITLTGAVSDDDLFEDRPRIYNRLGGSLKLFYDLTLDFDIGQVSDNAYLGDYGYHNFSDFDTDVTLRKEFLNKENSFSGAQTLLWTKKIGQLSTSMLPSQLIIRRLLKVEYYLKLLF